MYFGNKFSYQFTNPVKSSVFQKTNCQLSPEGIEIIKMG